MKLDGIIDKSIAWMGKDVKLIGKIFEYNVFEYIGDNWNNKSIDNNVALRFGNLSGYPTNQGFWKVVLRSGLPVVVTPAIAKALKDRQII